MKPTLIIFGGYSIALEIYEVAIEHYQEKFENIMLAISNSDTKTSDNQLFDQELPDFINKNKCVYIISFINQQMRVKVEKLMKSYSIEAANIIHPSAIVYKSVQIGNGNYIAANVILSSNVTINNHVIINYSCTIGHDTVIHDHVIIHPGSNISGNVSIGARSLIGSNTFIFQGKSIGEDTIIDALTYVDRDIESNMICSSKTIKVFKRSIPD